eukprot:TRINITY_DN5480_c0_g1_i2.p2 TRINITY_DN5480_c0_g1~~TRINITY_DN5480_c0_g1_i2.p2  ORF type:complete len:139 (+),score=42.50 TRINITY_DN5480_c0_g1_i2:140-556(+)
MMSNVLEFDENDEMTGNVIGPIVDGELKRKLVIECSRRMGLDPKESVAAIGDGSNDRFMINEANIGCAYHGKEILKKAVDHCIEGRMDGFIYFLGIEGKDGVIGDECEGIGGDKDPSIHDGETGEWKTYPGAQDLGLE